MCFILFSMLAHINPGFPVAYECWQSKAVAENIHTSIPLVCPMRVLHAEFFPKVWDQETTHIRMRFFLHDVIAGNPVLLPALAPLHIPTPPAHDVVVHIFGVRHEPSKDPTGKSCNDIGIRDLDSWWPRWCAKQHEEEHTMASDHLRSLENKSRNSWHSEAEMECQWPTLCHC